MWAEARYVSLMASDGGPGIDGVRQTIARYCFLCDDGRFEEWGDLFTVDTRFHVMGNTQHGRAATVEFIEAGQPPEQRGKHLIGASLVLLDGDHATAWTDFIFVDRRGAVLSSGRYHDELIRSDDGAWRFAVREIVFTGATPELTDGPP
jgi:3-phenylpropionate/cinnamic acid dioxygenase small subunit